MKIVVAVDSFKGCMTSAEAGEIIAEPLRRDLPDDHVEVIPIGDGGEGTAAAILGATGGEIRSASVIGPLGAEVDAEWGLLSNGKTAVMDMASASGIELVDPEALDPMTATTFGTGQLMLAALDEGAREIVIGLGGSATIDGGTGMAQAIGYRLLDVDGRSCPWGGRGLLELYTIDGSGVAPAIARTEILVVCDVTNPLLGETGAARVYGPQKGATPEMIERLDRGLTRLAGVWRRQGMLEAPDQPGDGAAGGLGAGLRAFCRAELCPGAELAAELTGFDREIVDADLLITGEGRTDRQTVMGKLPMVLARRARAKGVWTILLSGAIADGVSEDLGSHFDEMHATVDDAVDPAEAIRGGRERLAAAAAALARKLSTTS